MIRHIATLLLLCAAPAPAAEWVPVFDSQLLLGQLFQEGKASAWQGNASMQFTPAVKFSDTLGLIPTYAADYQGTKSVTELGGGGQLFQDSMSHTLNVKGVYKATEQWKLKPTLGYRWELLRETRDESFGSGLFDYQKPSVGLETDYAFTDQVKGSAAFDYYRIHFPNYASLESKSPGLGREQAQARTLDTENYSWSWGGTFPLPFEGGWGKLAFNVTDRLYPEQHLVVASGQLTAEKRLDDIKSVSGTLNYGHAFNRRVAALGSFSYTQTRYASNQNHYDAELNVFNREYYSYDESSLQPRLTMILGAKHVQYSMAYLLIRRHYLGRLAQDAAGGYLRDTTTLRQDSFLFDLSVPLEKGFKLIAQVGLTRSSSNTLNEKTFRYNYTLSNHLVGFSWSY